MTNQAININSGVNRRGVLLAVAMLLSPAPHPSAQSRPAAARVVLANVTVVDVRDGSLHPGMSVAIEDGHIARIVKSGAPEDGARGSVRVDGSGKYLIPGLWDMHVHLEFGDWFPGARDIDFPLFIANGVTGVRDMGSDLDSVLTWRTEIDAGRLLGPRIVTSGPMLDGPKPRFPASIAIATPEDGRRAVRTLKQRGVDFIKFQSLIPRDAVFAIADEAKKEHMVFVGHVPDAVRASEMSNAGQKSFEHLIGVFEGSSPNEDAFLKGPKGPGKFVATYDPARAARLAALLAKNQTWQCPTLIWEKGQNLIDESDFAHDPLGRYAPASWRNGAWRRFTDQINREFNTDDRATREKFVVKELVVTKLLHDAGVPFLAGTDTPAGVYVFPGFSLQQELQRFVAAGFTPLAALKTATLNPAIFFGREKELGTVEEGKVADLVLLDANPLVDIRNTQKIAAVVVRGRYLARKELDGLLAGAAATAAKR
jgi:imidazolonepropionase-like amidohydrolase